jgi:predicted RNase H-like nuclease (RuvC/YqgF family)
MITKFKHKYKIGDTVFHVNNLTVEETVVTGVSYDESTDFSTGEEVSKEILYKLEDNLYLREEQLYESFYEASKSREVIKFYESEIKRLENVVMYSQKKIGEYKQELAKLS